MLSGLFAEAHWQASVYQRNTFGREFDILTTGIVIRSDPQCPELDVVTTALDTVGISYRVEEAEIKPLALGLLPVYMLIGKQRTNTDV
jgi:hypothetical protein